jgi:hypothetical protein
MQELAHTADMEVGQQTAGNFILPPLDVQIDRESIAIEPVVSSLTKNDFAEMMFMEELVKIRVEPLNEKNPRKMIDLYVNGKAEWVPVGRPWIMRRKYVEVLARSKPMSVQTKHESAEESLNPQNEVIRTTSSQFPFSVLEDTPRGIEWLNRLMAEG